MSGFCASSASARREWRKKALYSALPAHVIGPQTDMENGRGCPFARIRLSFLLQHGEDSKKRDSVNASTAGIKSSRPPSWEIFTIPCPSSRSNSRGGSSHFACAVVITGETNPSGGPFFSREKAQDAETAGGRRPACMIVSAGRGVRKPVTGTGSVVPCERSPTRSRCPPTTKRLVSGASCREFRPDEHAFRPDHS